MTRTEEIKQMVAKRQDRLNALNDEIWNYAELYFREEKSSAALIRMLKEEGFEVEEQVDGMDTAFIGTWGSGRPVIGILGEFDALPSLSQKAACPVHEEITPGGNGHGCGHCALGTAALGAAAAAKEYMEKHQIQGTIKYFGCPAEEAGWGKMFLARDGYFNGLDAIYTWHPGTANMIWSAGCLANVCAYFTFKGKTAHAAASPHLGRSALDACELMSMGVNYLREHIIPEARVHYAYVDVGGIAPNVVQDHAAVHYFIRAPRVYQMMEIYDRVCDVARGAALMTGTQLEIQIHEGLSDYVPNGPLTKVLYKALQEVGAPQFDDADRQLAAEIRKSLTEDQLQSFQEKYAGVPEMQELIEKGAVLCDIVLPYTLASSPMGGSTDVGDASYCAPTAQINVATEALATPGHTWQVTAQSCSSIAHKGTIKAAEAMALGAIYAMEDPELLKEAKAELLKSNGGAYQCPMPKEIKPTL